ncbi:MAG TPA: TRAP transporter small permease [Rhodospirillales bacterium]|nr:TRAP transporter small permease [Rhodospirillales bacterium]
MERIFNVYVRINDIISAAAFSLGALIMGFALIALFSGAIERYFIGMGYAWINDLPPMLMPWAIFPILGALIRTDGHIRVEILPTLVQGRTQTVIRLAVYVICLISALVFCWGSSGAVAFFRTLGEVTETEIEFPIWYMYLAFPVGFGLLANFSFESALRECRRLMATEV